MFQNKINFLSSLLTIFLLGSCQSKDTFDWNAGLSAPKFYESSGPYVEYFYKGKSITGASSGTGADQGWEITSGGYVGGDKFKPVPDSIFVSWICVADGYQYEGGHKLPANLINLFKKGTIDMFGNSVKYGVVTAGMAPRGNVTVWLQSGVTSTELCKFKVLNKGIWKENDHDYKKYISEHRKVSEGFKSSNIFRYLHGIPYKIWETGEKEFQYDIGFTTEDENKKDYSIAIAGYTKDGSVIYSNRDPIPYVNWNEKINLKVKNYKKLPVQLWIRWHSQDGIYWYETEVVLPIDLENQFLRFNKKYGENIFLIVGMNTVLENTPYSFGKIWFENSKGKTEIMKFRTSKFNIKKNDFEVSKYSLPKGFVFPKWEGREPLTKPSDFEYWQEK